MFEMSEFFDDLPGQPPDRMRAVGDVAPYNHVFDAGRAVDFSCMESRIARTTGWNNADKLE